METNCNEITCTSASSHRLQQHCLCALEIRTHTKCCMLESMFEARILKFATVELSYVACTSNIGNHNKHLHLKQYAYIIFFTHRRMILLKFHIDRCVCQNFSKYAKTQCKNHSYSIHAKYLINFFPKTNTQQGPQLNLWNGYEVGIIRRMLLITPLQKNTSLT